MTPMGGAMAGAPPISVCEEEWSVIREILRCFASGRTVWCYGSRARGVGVRRYSDLDLMVGGEPLSAMEEWKLEEAFDESRLPFRVEVQQEAEVSADFRERVERDFVVLQDG